MSDSPLILAGESQGDRASADPSRDQEAPQDPLRSEGSPQPGLEDTGLNGLVMLARFHNIAADPDQLAHEFKTAGLPFTTEQILLAAKHLGLNAKRVKVDVARLDRTPLPAMALDVDGRFFILARIDGDQLMIQDPNAPRPQVLSMAEFQARWTGELILFASRASLAGELAKFDFTWFIPAIVKYRKLLAKFCSFHSCCNSLVWPHRCSSRSSWIRCW
jgi:subfamily B ATP-binding cassette protein HlyB/CyaB